MTARSFGARNWLPPSTTRRQPLLINKIRLLCDWQDLRRPQARDDGDSVNAADHQVTWGDGGGADLHGLRHDACAAPYAMRGSWRTTFDEMGDPRFEDFRDVAGGAVNK